MRKLNEFLLKFTVDRLITRPELYEHRHVTSSFRHPFKTHELRDEKGVISINSTYLEVADVHYKERGFLTVFLIVFLILFSGVLGLFTWGLLRKGLIWDLVQIYFIFSLAFIIIYIGMKTECFKLTHYPIRFNRKERKVHLFRMDGTVSTYNWDDIFFTLVQRKPDGVTARHWYLCGLILDEDGLTVKDMFTLGMYDLFQHEVLPFWELIRRYMEDEDGVQNAVNSIQYYLPIARTKETYTTGLEILTYKYRYRLAKVILFPLSLLESLGRWVSMRTSKIPQWPVEIEAQCQIADNDPYHFDSNNFAIKS
ncbi:hypothetical protein C3432_06045 [Citrobacter amalonaticus]|uniref:DUF6708 domain-containing protein n=2 Tax=Citrobacter amalonaticus TaxID=35703 RepID=A0A2S4RQS6_CITAM|nr:DUF6708 domain-containing protein [Citrobacter amalonaticus]POT57521.1 hypothetical protein C3432_06045 [Citrobacter amalonaticus]POT76952.1 hypothetical protein C3436_05775 [Citrobacter amalonaticus]POU60217.1 hypothetical protein C3430_25950 [Citrobacter amalonaticus]POV06187.1 hypothetical protein C3424_13075 [Citrobacter amalonaticus]